MQRIFEIRKVRGITLKELGNVCGVSSVAGISSIENGDVPLKAGHLPAIAKLLGVEIWELFRDYSDSESWPSTKEEGDLLKMFRGMSDTDRNTIINLMMSLSKTHRMKESVIKRGTHKKAA